jgi:hypothetical protein
MAITVNFVGWSLGQQLTFFVLDFCFKDIYEFEMKRKIKGNNNER